MRRIVLVFLVGLLGPAAPGQAGAFFKCMPLYGNWCGIDHPPKGTFPPPVDEFDAACMRHDFCTAGAGPLGNDACDRMLVAELNGLRARYGFLPRPLRWIEYALRVKSGGPWGGMPIPAPGDAFGFMESLTAPCW